MAPAHKPIVCFVTPTSENAKSVKAFKALLDDLQEDKITWRVFGANGTNANLAQNVADAWTFVKGTLGDPPFVVPVVFVAGGSLAASALASNANTGTYPIIQAAGGSIPSGAPANMKGFYLNVPGEKTICQKQYDQLTSVPNNTPVAVLYDSTNDNATQDILHSLTNYAGTHNLNIVDIGGDANKLKVNTLTDLLQTPNTGNDASKSFMLIPNALFYEKCDDIAKAVDNVPLQNAIYPEREYKNAHPNKNGKQVLGHKIGLTFGQAAYYVDSVLNDKTCIATLTWQEAITDP
jgi:hypothetical protein